MKARRVLRGALGAFALLLIVPAVTLAHPLGNFTINHYAALRIGTSRIDLDVVIDQAEIPTFQERQRIDRNRDGVVDAGETETERQAACGTLATQLALTVDGTAVPLEVSAAGLSFPTGAGGLATMRLVCELGAPLPVAMTKPMTIAFTDASHSERVGWREIVAIGDHVLVSDAPPLGASRSARLTSYPTDLLATPPDVRTLTIAATAGGPAAPEFAVPDARPLDDATAAPVTPAAAAAVPGGVGEGLAGLIGTRDLTPPIVAISLLLAAGLGALHAVSPGHGKTVMAAYLVGTRGSARHAIALGLAVTASHTLGIVVLAALTLFAGDLVPPERLYPILGLASGITVVGIGGWLLLARLRALRAERAHRSAHVHGYDHGTEDHHAAPMGEHRHGGMRHSHVTTHGDLRGNQLSWRNLVALGLAGGLVPSASALILLLGAVALGRPLYGLVLAIAFGVGMAVVLGGIGYLLVVAGTRIERWSALERLRPVASLVPWATAAVVLGSGIFLTTQALHTTF